MPRRPDNAAASTGPRPFTSMIPLPCATLQRGRARAGAECCAADSCQDCHALLQRGRARAGAECISFSLISSSSFFSFNGAAPARARNDAQAGKRGRRVFDASTGPRPRGRGMPARSARRACQSASLQRGRARAGAECGCCGAGEVMHAVKLQRGRARAGAECKSSCETCASLLRASTGPRPRGRGMCQGLTPFPDKPMRFNGAAPARARNGSARRPSSSRHPASTGPRPRGRGMRAF